MFKVLEKNLIITLVAVITTIAALGVSTKILFKLHDSNTTNEKMQYSSIKEVNMTCVSTNAKNNEENYNEELNSIIDIENLSNNDANYEQITNSQLEKSNNNYENNQKIINFQQRNSNNYSEINNQKIINIKTESLKNTNNQQVASTQPKSENVNTNVTSEPKDKNINQNTTVEHDNENIDTNTMTEAKEENIDSNIASESENETVRENTTPEPEISEIYYDRTTSIYDDDRVTLLRVEYYLNNKLTYYSVIEQFDVTTKSYIEKIYKCNLETNIDPLVRTDVYYNGNLTNSY